MAQGEFTKEEARATLTAVEVIMKAIPKKKAAELIGEFNDTFLFLRAAEKAAPEKAGG